jgi:predicted ATP-grasp superfamily ATP-dependent carboligase
VRILVLGVSARAMAASAIRGGHDVVAVDFFGDRDQALLVESYALGRDLGLPLTAEGLGEAARRLGAEAVVYGANLENHAAVVARLAGEHEVLGNPPEVLREVRDWALLRRACEESGIAHPVTLLPGEEADAVAGRWLRKRVRSGGGHGVRRWDGRPLDEDHVLQSEVDGVPASVAFVADGRDCRILGLSEQLIGRAALGSSGFGWCGNILPLDLSPAESAAATVEVRHMASKLTRRFGLRGVNGMDVVIGRDQRGVARPHIVEINPRYSGSMELLEDAGGVNVFSAHLDACGGQLPDAGAAPSAAPGCLGKAIVYARRQVTTPDTCAWLARGVRDVPHSRQTIAAGHPICTVMAEGRDRRECLAGLLERAAVIYAESEGRREERRERPTHLDHRTYA